MTNAIQELNDQASEQEDIAKLQEILAAGITPLTQEEVRETILSNRTADFEGSDEEFVAKYLGEIQEEALEQILEENPAGGMSIFLELCNFGEREMTYIAQIEGQNANANIQNYVPLRLSGIESITNICYLAQKTSDALEFLFEDNSNSANMYKANQIREAITDFAGEFSDEGRAKAYYLCSKMFRKISAQNAGFGGEEKAKSEELDCLREVLNNTSDHKLAAYCKGRIASGSADEKLAIRAYKRSVQSSEIPADIRRVNMDLGDMYKEKARVIGYVPQYETLDKSEQCYWKAYHASEKRNQITPLKNIAELAIMGRDHDKWEIIKLEIAEEHLSGVEQAKAFMAIGDKIQNKRVKYYQKALGVVAKSKKPSIEEKILKNKISTTLEEMQPKKKEITQVKKPQNNR